MPIYEYACPKCGEFEVTQRITDEPLRKCPTCRSKVRKLISSTSFQLKGSGWYITDYGRKGTDKEKAGEGKSEGASKTESAGESTPSASGEGKSETGAKSDGGTKSGGGTKAKSGSKSESSKAAA